MVCAGEVSRFSGVHDSVTFALTETIQRAAGVALARGEGMDGGPDLSGSSFNGGSENPLSVRAMLCRKPVIPDCRDGSCGRPFTLHPPPVPPSHPTILAVDQRQRLFGGVADGVE